MNDTLIPLNRPAQTSDLVSKSKFAISNIANKPVKTRSTDKAQPSATPNMEVIEQSSKLSIIPDTKIPSDYIIKFTDQESGQVISQFPSEKMVNISHKIHDYLDKTPKGQLIDSLI